MSDICVIGAGPAGCVFAARMAQLGHAVHLIERQRFPRRRLGELLSPGVMPLLRSAGLHQRIEAAEFPRVRKTWVKWGDEWRLREDARAEGMLVDRGAFDQRLLDEARSVGVHVHEPARVTELIEDKAGWRLKVEAHGREEGLRADFLADASGRRRLADRRDERTGAPTLAVFAYWRAAKLPAIPRIESGRDMWYWGVPLPDGTYNTLIFVNPHEFRTMPGSSLSDRFLRRLERSSLMDECRDAALAGAPSAVDATPYLDRGRVTPSSIRVGDSALAVDPISSSGVQKAIQNALSAAIVANTLLRRPESRTAACDFYRARLTQASERHRAWAAEHYATVAAANDNPFWTERSTRPSSPPSAERVRVLDAAAFASTAVELSRDVQFVRSPCLDGDYVVDADAIWRPGLDGPVAFLGGQKLVPLLRRLAEAGTPLQIARSWTDRIPLQSGLAIAAWLVNHGVLVQKGNDPTVRAQ